MAITFDPATQRIILDSASVTATELYSRWVDWAATGDNAKYGMVFRQVGSDDLGGGLSIPPYYFLQGNWRVRPMESSHNLTITGNLFVDGGGVPVVSTLGTYQVNVNYTVPVQAQGIATGGGGGATAAEIATEVWSHISRTLTSGSTSAFATPLAYKASNTTTASDPGAGRIRWNNATQASATQIYIDTTTDDGIDLTNYVRGIPAGATLYVQDKDDAGKYQRWTINLGTDNTGWVTFNVAPIVSAGGNIANNASSVVLFNAASSGSGSDMTPDDILNDPRFKKLLTTGNFLALKD